MELRQLEYFIAVSEELHFTRAAEKLGISQPTLSQQIRALEDELDIPLFDRIGKKIAITEAGSILLEQSLQIVRNLQNVKDSIAELHNYKKGSFVVGALPSDLDYRISNLLIDYHKEFPKIWLKIVSSVEIAAQVLENEVDIGIGIMPFPDDRLVRIPLCREEYVLVVSERHAWAGRDSIGIEELRGLDTVMFPSGLIGRELVDDCCRKYGFTMNTIMETTSITSVIHLVKANIGATVQPLPLIRSLNDPALRTIRIADDPPTRNIGIIYRTDRFLGHAAKAFMQKAAEHFTAR
ncbi:LysR family transcriptional regulator [Paenibacillus doosanensis]|uniref:HTH-type transcriptional regulator CynR n=1 Tax=Paenibacillus konkukensis TaxID=2020716 RepID=A0ABY4S1I3_9BACL|nr:MULTISPECIES: LysR family transcriptional regulator [Paenibacillus]MCS7463343.1 LysR family transcriptional regulator [Paenibacillus doosanensis]UQZ87650.1 HTH-type transcriptional regulator CynR [Paenibacillus konkukensis]